MKIRTLRFASSLSSALALAFAIGAQSVKISPPPSPSPAPSAQQSAPVLKAETIAIPVRVVVRDRKGHVVTNLTKSDFRLFQDGHEQPIANFTPISASSTLAESSEPSSGGQPPASVPPSSPNSTRSLPTAVPARFVALFFDDMHLQSKDLDYTTADADKYLASLPATDHVAIFTSSRQNELGFTTDRDKLHDAIMNLQIHPAAAAKATAMPIATGCPAMDYWEADAIVNGSGQAAASALNGAMQELWVCSHADPNSMPPQLATAVVLNTARAALAQADAQTDAVLERIEEIVHGLSSLDGQRVIVLISPGFFYATHRRELSDIIDRAIRSDVVVNTIETRRGFNLVAMARSASQGRPPSLSQENLGAVESTAASDSQKLLAEIADSTGGRLFVGSDDYSSAFSHLAGAPEFYYLLAYSPQNLPADGKYHTIRVRLAPKLNYKVETRHGFYAPSRAETAEEAANREIEDALFSNEEEHRLPVKFETQVFREASGLQKMAVKADVDASQLDFRNVNSLSQENLTVAAAVFDGDGNYVDGTQKTDQMNLDSATMAQLTKTGFYLELDFYLKPGQYTVRLIARDSNDESISAENAIVTVSAEPRGTK